MKTDMDKQKIDELMYVREGQEYELGRNCQFRRREAEVVFKDMSNFRNSKDSQNMEINQLKDNKQTAAQEEKLKKKKRTFVPRFEDQFMEKMMVHARNHLKKEGEYLVRPGKEQTALNMLIGKKGKLNEKHVSEMKREETTMGHMDEF